MSYITDRAKLAILISAIEGNQFGFEAESIPEYFFEHGPQTFCKAQIRLLGPSRFEIKISYDGGRAFVRGIYNHDSTRQGSIFTCEDDPQPMARRAVEDLNRHELKIPKSLSCPQIREKGKSYVL